MPLTMDGDQVPVNDGELVINLSEGDTLMCDWYRFPGGITAEDAGGDDNDSNYGVTFDPETGDASAALTGGQIFLRTWQCAATVERPADLNDDPAAGLAALTNDCTPDEEPISLFLGELSVVGTGDVSPDPSPE